MCRSKRIRRCTCQVKPGYSSGTTREPCAARCNVGRVTPKAVLAAARSSNLGYAHCSCRVVGLPASYPTSGAGNVLNHILHQAA